MSVTTTGGDGVWEFRLDPSDGCCKVFINDYFLYAQHAWFMLSMHVGELKVDPSQPIKITISIENVEKPHD
jgi:hypothetical protein